MAIATTYQITEYGSFVSGKEVPGCVTLPENTFDQLEAFLLQNPLAHPEPSSWQTAIGTRTLWS